MSQPNRKTVDTITDDELDALYERLAKAERAINLLADSHRRAEEAEATVARVRHAVMNQSYLGSLDESIQAALDGPTQQAAVATGSDSATAAGP